MSLPINNNEPISRQILMYLLYVLKKKLYIDHKIR